MGGRRAGGRWRRHPGAAGAVGASRARPSQCENREGSIADAVDGAFARYVLVDSASLLRLPDGLSSRQAALAEPLAVALHGITRSGVSPGDRVMVFGAGPIGALTIAALVARGIGPVVAVEPGERRARLARDLGADEVLHPSELEVFPMWEPERIAEGAVHVVLECSGKKEAIEAGFNQLRQGGTLVLVGAGIEAPAFDPNRLLLNELHVVGSFVYDQGRIRASAGPAGLRRIPHRPVDRGGRRAPGPDLRSARRTGRGPLRRQGDGRPPVRSGVPGPGGPAGTRRRGD